MVATVPPRPWPTMEYDDVSSFEENLKAGKLRSSRPGSVSFERAMLMSAMRMSMAFVTVEFHSVMGEKFERPVAPLL